MNKKVLVIAIVSLALTAFPASRGTNAESFCFSKKVVHKLDIEIAKQMREMKLPGNLHGYSWNAQKGRFEDKTILNPALAGGAGAMISTMSDLKIYAKALCVGSLLKSETQKSRLETKHLEGTPEFVAYGEGITRIGRFYGHNGTIFGFSSEMWYLPEKDAVILISVNRLDEDDESKASNLFFALTKEVFPEYVNW